MKHLFPQNYIDTFRFSDTEVWLKLSAIDEIHLFISSITGVSLDVAGKFNEDPRANSPENDYLLLLATLMMYKKHFLGEYLNHVKEVSGTLPPEYKGRVTDDALRLTLEIGLIIDDVMVKIVQTLPSAPAHQVLVLS